MTDSEPDAPGALTAVLVDDEELARGVLKELLAAHPEVRVVAECENGFAAVKAVAEASPDVLFLDVQMPKLDGFEVLELLASSPAPLPAVVFTTAYDQHAVRAFEVHAVDYLLKPFGQARFDEALARAVERARARRPHPVDPEALLSASRPAGAFATRIAVKEGARVAVLAVDRLDYALAEDDYVRLVSGEKSHLKQQTLSDLAARLDPSRFVRVHRSALLNLDRLARFTRAPGGTGVATLEGGAEVPVSRAGAARLLALLDPSKTTGD